MLLAGLVLGGCGAAAADSGQRDAETIEVAAPVLPELTGSQVAEPAPTLEVEFAADGPQADETFALDLQEPEPIAQRIARQLLTVYATPDAQGAIRGRVPMGRAFDVFAHVQGPGCETQWADVGNGGFVCLDRTRPAGDREPYAEPKLRGYGGLTPFFYARIRKGEPAPRWRSLAAFARGAEPSDTLSKGTDYAFIARKWHKGQIVLIDERGRVVRDKDVHTFRPSRFAGHDLRSEPLDDGQTLVWVKGWPSATTHASPSTDAAVIEKLDYHRKLSVSAEPFANERGRWFHLDDGSWMSASELAVWSPKGTRPTGVLADEIWLDVDLEQQTMTAYEGDAPIFVTLVSSGFKAPTPRGLFRIHLKQAVGDMSSSPGDSDFYNVQAVPFVQYFAGGFAIHGAYWHNYFGRPISHGCVNLSPRDAKTIFDLTGPSLSEGWLHGYETAEQPGTTVRIRKGDETVQDKRGPVEPVFGT